MELFIQIVIGGFIWTIIIGWVIVGVSTLIDMLDSL